MLEAEGLVLFLGRAVLLRLVTALAGIVVLVVIAAFLMGRAAVPADLGLAACIDVGLIALILMTLDPSLVRVASIALAAHDFFSCWRFWAPLPSLPC